MDAYQYGNGFSRQVLFLREQAEKRFLDAFDLREDLTRQVKPHCKPTLTCSACPWCSSQRLDGKDELFAGQAELGSNDKGRFALYWSQPTPGQLTSMALPESDIADTSTGPSGEPANAWFTCPRTTLKPCVIEPYFYTIDGQNVLMTSIVFPLMVNGKLIASLSVDINLNSLQTISQSASQSSTTARPRSASSARPACSPATAPTPASSASAWTVDTVNGAELVRMLAASSKIRSLHSQQQLKVLAPFQPIPGGKPWGVLLDVPEKVLVGPAET
jgi:methyl-accepting chemotaxis protein